MAHGNPVVRKLALQKIIAVHPEFTAEQALAAVDRLDRAGVLTVNGLGESVLTDLNDQKYAEVLRLAPNLVQPSDISSRYPDQAKVRKAMHLEAMAGAPPAPTFDADKYREAAAKIPKSNGSERDTVRRAMALEQAAKDAGFTSADPNGGG